MEICRLFSLRQEAVPAERTTTTATWVGNLDPSAPKVERTNLSVRLQHLDQYLHHSFVVAMVVEQKMKAESVDTSAHLEVKSAERNIQAAS